jgi:hypothetical protein
VSTDRDLERIVRSWMDEGVTALPDRVLDAVLDQIPATPQRRTFWLARRFPIMNNKIVRSGIAAAAVVILAVVGVNLLPRSGGFGGDASPLPSPSSTVQPSPSPTPAAFVFPPEGELAIGSHTAVLEGVPLSFTVRSSGWTSGGDGGSIFKGGEYELPDSAGINFWSSAPENVYADPCAHTPLSPPPGASTAGLAAAVMKLPGIDVVAEPTGITIDGRPGQYVAFAIREDIDCDPHEFYLWYDESTGGASGGWRWAAALGALHRVWIIDVDGKVVWIDSETFKGAKPELDQEIQQIIESIQFP